MRAEAKLRQHLAKGGIVLKDCVTAVAVLAIVSLPVRISAGQSAEDEARTRARITIMENALREAVRIGAGNLTAQFRNATALDVRVETMFIGVPEAQGIKVKPHGMVFFVRVPSMNATVTWALQNVPRGGPQSQVPPGQQSQASGRPPGQVVAQSVPLSNPGDVLVDPVAAYRTAVMESLVDTMLEQGGNLRLAPGERLTVSARRDTPPNPRDPSDDVRTVTFTVSAETLDSYHQQKLNIVEARKLVEVDGN